MLGQDCLPDRNGSGQGPTGSGEVIEFAQQNFRIEAARTALATFNQQTLLDMEEGWLLRYQ